MRKRVIAPAAQRVPQPEREWLEIEELATIEVTSEDPNFPIESALSSGTGPGWRAAERGSQIIRFIFDKLRRLHRIRVEFRETEMERTQEFSLRWSAEPAGPLKEIVRQQWKLQPARINQRSRRLSG